ncbi:hypothetical protein CK510_11020 [Brunnivagina elsteri CCALA 953]|uniref:Uncharacterized protein n=1 Tax=Brunnivagina elsteri CCALA 953 TaxID=987040 RepID=A0A2A2TJJ4_9CYAN|nr:hypothetical protein CK510_11020 [Calothrix elsteri CCALA 953]
MILIYIFKSDVLITIPGQYASTNYVETTFDDFGDEFAFRAIINSQYGLVQEKGDNKNILAI